MEKLFGRVEGVGEERPAAGQRVAGGVAHGAGGPLSKAYPAF
ncbi:hypothetical protein [Hymenobacter psoromatis]|nr:hypothetical protein [Hymenobacter psoromatis]